MADSTRRVKFYSQHYETMQICVAHDTLPISNGGGGWQQGVKCLYKIGSSGGRITATELAYT